MSAINYYNTRIERVLDKLDVYSFSVVELEEKINKCAEQLKKGRNIKMSVRFLIPDVNTRYLRMARAENWLKSHEIREVTDIIGKKIQDAIYKKADNYNKHFDKFKMYKNNLLINIRSNYVYTGKAEGRRKRNYLEVEIVIKNTTKVNSRDLIILIKLFLEGSVNFSEKIHVSFSGLSRYLDFKIPLKRTEKLMNGDFLTLKDKERVVEYYSEPLIQSLIIHFLHPMSEKACKVTLDKLRDNLPVKKSLRVEISKNKFVKFSEIVSLDIESEVLSNLVILNDIEGFYAGVLNTNNMLAYLVIDIDVSKYFRMTFSKQEIWDLILKITSNIVSVGKLMGIEGFPLIKYSGSRGIHIMYRYEKNILKDDLKRLNLGMYFYTFPGLFELIKIGKSPLKSKKSFSRLIADSLIAHVLFFTTIELPQKFKEKLGKSTKLTDIFKISVFSNELAILLDTSPSVVRTIMSIHPSGLVSIPIFSCEQGCFFNTSLLFDDVLKEAEIETVLEHIRKNDDVASNYDQIGKSAMITKNNIEYILKPHKLLPVMAIIMRFSRRFGLERPVGSFWFWYNHYQVLFAYEYFENIALRRSIVEKKDILKELGDICNECSLIQKGSIINITQLFLNDKIPAPVFKERLRGYYLFEWYYRIAPKQLSVYRDSIVGEIIKNRTKREELLNHFRNLQLIMINLLLDNYEKTRLNSSNRKKIAVLKLHLRITKFIELKSRIMRTKFDDKSKILVEGAIISSLHNIWVTFLKDFFTFSQILGRRRL